MHVSLKYAEEHFTDLAAAASNGEEVEISLPGKPAVFLAPRPSESTFAPSKRRRAGCPIHGVLPWVCIRAEVSIRLA
jgi:antitoxin (DNA-binding transcriptional repressor) of toxin-antitoxin stability system